MDTSSTKPVVEVPVASRLPAGSTLEISPGVHVPHPHAEVNLPGAGDPRVGETDAVTEFVKFETKTVDASENKDSNQVVVATVGSKPLAEEVKAKVVTVSEKLKTVDNNPPTGTQAPLTDGEHLAEQGEGLEKTT